MKFFEDIAIGERAELGSHTFTADDIKRFANAFDPQAFHTDEALAEKTHFGKLCASGWHTMAVWMKLNVRERQRTARNLEMSGIPVAKIGPSPGFDELKWLKPVYAGDTISYSCEVVGKHESRSRPQWGLLSFRSSGRNQHGEKVVSFIGHVFIERRDQGAGEGA